MTRERLVGVSPHKATNAGQNSPKRPYLWLCAEKRRWNLKSSGGTFAKHHLRGFSIAGQVSMTTSKPAAWARPAAASSITPS